MFQEHTNVFIGINAGNSTVLQTAGIGNVLVGPYTHGTDATANDQHAFGDIRAAFGVATWATVSDERFKKDIEDSTAGLSFINTLRPRTFKYRNLGELPETFRSYEAGSTKVFKNSYTNHGFIAQEVKAAIDADSSIKDGFNLWDYREDGSQEVAEAALIPVLVKAIQEQQAIIDDLKARIETLEGA
jgi:trimeric autotransporter adhesin